jgi:flagellar biosynthesis/type III secretory pathway protein FliH
VTGTEVALVISATGGLIVGIGGIWIQVRGQNEARAARMALGSKMELVQKATDGLSERLGETKLKQGTAEGHAAGLEQGRNEKDRT